MTKVLIPGMYISTELTFFMSQYICNSKNKIFLICASFMRLFLTTLTVFKHNFNSFHKFNYC